MVFPFKITRAYDGNDGIYLTYLFLSVYIHKCQFL